MAMKTKTNPRKIQVISFDSKQISSDAIDIWIKSLAAFGVHVYDHRAFTETDTYGLILSNEMLTEKDIDEICGF
jgi:hypothetical protein